MARSREETRREFLLRVARTAAFVPPLMATLDVRPLSAQGSGGGGGGGGGGKGGGKNTTTASTVGSLSPTAQIISNPTINLNQSQSATAPWSPQDPGQPPPWSRPPPTQTGR